MADTNQAVADEAPVCSTCSAACPVHTDTQGYVDLLARGRFEEAFEKIREFNPFPSTCSLICHHPCEEACRRANVDESVALRNLKRFAVEQAMDYRTSARHVAAITQAKSVGVVGAGPAGMSVAHDCILAGYAVTVYEALGNAGGMLAFAIPKYRLPAEALALDLEDITSLGVEVKTGMRVGTDVSMDELLQRHDAVVIAVGLSGSRSIPIDNIDHAGVVGAIPFLRDASTGSIQSVPAKVIVIGGGNVAVDCARTAARLGASTVRMVCLESEEEMPAWKWECEEALEEGIEIMHRLGPTAVVVDGGRVTGITTRQVQRVFDEQGRFSPTYFDERTGTVEGELVVVAIGQMSDVSFVKDTPVKVDERGRLVFDRDACATSQAGVFSCGEVVTGPGSAIEAVASGHRAATAVIGYLKTGSVAPVAAAEVRKVDDLPQETAAKVRRAQRIAMPAMSPAERKKSFVQFELGYDEKAALREARRCLSCVAGAEVDDAKCAACLTCLRVCPFGVPAVDDVAVMCSEMCQACGLCAVECPALAISVRRFAAGDTAGRIVRLMEGSSRQVGRVEIVCVQDAESFAVIKDRLEERDGQLVAVVPVECAARVDEVDMMKPFEFGAEHVLVKRCAQCRYRGADERLARRVERTRSLLVSAGIDGGKLVLE